MTLRTMATVGRSGTDAAKHSRIAGPQPGFALLCVSVCARQQRKTCARAYNTEDCDGVRCIRKMGRAM